MIKRKIFPWLVVSSSLFSLAVLAAFVFLAVSFVKDAGYLKKWDETEVPFVGRMEMPSASDFRVVDNSAGRDLVRLEAFMDGRAAGLHWLGDDFFNKKTKDDIELKVHLSIDSMGVFTCLGMSFAGPRNRDLEMRLKDHIEQLWRYRRSVSGRTELWMPLRWKVSPSK